ncbi:MAG: cupredoxin domain-containing protein [Candidatus Nitrosocosmicus sp.]
MSFIFYSIVFISLTLFLVNINCDPKIYAASKPVYKNNNPEGLTNLLNNNSNRAFNLTLNGGNNNISIYGIVDTSFSTSKNNLWIASGKWSLKLKDNIPIFDLNMTWHNNQQSTIRAYHIFNFKPFLTSIGSFPNNLLLTKGTSDISLNNQIQPSVPITIQIQQNKTMILFYNDIVINRHFGNQPLNGMVTSVNFNNNLNNKEIPATDNNKNNASYDIARQQQEGENIESKNSIQSPNNLGNPTELRFDNGTKNTTTATTTTTAITDSNSIVIPKNAAFIGNPSYLPEIIKINQGDKLVVVNKDNNYHTVTSMNKESADNPQLGRYFDTGVIYPQNMIAIDTTKLRLGEYPFECSIHPFMKGTLIVK